MYSMVRSSQLGRIVVEGVAVFTVGCRNHWLNLDHLSLTVPYLRKFNVTFKNKFHIFLFYSTF